MNCKPDQLAMIVKCEPGNEWSLGLVLKTVRIWPESLQSNPVWEYVDCDKLERLKVFAVADKVLMPLEGEMPVKHEKHTATA